MGGAPGSFTTIVSSLSSRLAGQRGGVALSGSLKDLLQVFELGDLAAHLPGDHGGHELHEPRWLEIECETDDGGRVSAVGQFEDTARPCRAGGDQELQPSWGVEERNPVVAV